MGLPRMSLFLDKPNRFHFSHSQPISQNTSICSIKPTHARGRWQLTSMTLASVPPPSPQNFLEVLQSWGNTGLWEHLSITGGFDWLHEAIKDGTQVAVTDGFYICKSHPNLCSVAFVMECAKGQGRLIKSFLEALLVANVYWGELLGLMAIHLILLSIDRIHCNLSRSVEVASDCLGALKHVTHLPPYRIPLHCQHSDILKKHPDQLLGSILHNIFLPCEGASG
jgi:hypothetical protein